MKQPWHQLSLLLTQLFVLVCLLCLFGVAQSVFSDHGKFNNRTHIHLTLYIDRHFNTEQAWAIQRAAERWTTATNHIAEVKTELLPTTVKNDPFSVIVLDVDPDFPAVIATDQENAGSTYGIYIDRGMEFPTIVLVSERIGSVDFFEQVAMHEIGHSLGLPHLEGDDNFFTVMYPSADLMSPTITFRDLRAFCRIYGCDTNKLHVEEPPHIDDILLMK